MISEDVILIITSVDDGHANAVVRHLNESGSDFLRINTDELLNGVHTISWQEKDNKIFVQFFNGHREFSFKSVKSIYYRRPSRPTSNNISTIQHKEVYIDESWSGLHSILFSLTEARWFGHPHLDKINSSKLKQKRIADELKKNSSKIKTPATILSNNPEELTAFCSKHSFILIKPIESRGTIEEDQWIPFFSEKISSSVFIESLAESSIPKLNYCFLQEYIEKKQEWRITVVDNKIFGCVILSQADERTITDWRRVGYEEITHLAADPPEFIREFCFLFLEKMDIHFGAFDFIETPSNEFYFLECNVNGQWLWIEECTGQHISKAIADALQYQ